MELSTQVSLQNEKITQLEEVLEEKEEGRFSSWKLARRAIVSQRVKDSPECLQSPNFL